MSLLEYMGIFTAIYYSIGLLLFCVSFMLEYLSYGEEVPRSIGKKASPMFFIFLIAWPLVIFGTIKLKE